jgi:hypothetical protein
MLKWFSLLLNGRSLCSDRGIQLIETKLLFVLVSSIAGELHGLFGQNNVRTPVFAIHIPCA